VFKADSGASLVPSVGHCRNAGRVQTLAFDQPQSQKALAAVSILAGEMQYRESRSNLRMKLNSRRFWRAFMGTVPKFRMNHWRNLDAAKFDTAQLAEMKKNANTTVVSCGGCTSGSQVRDHICS